MYFIDDNGMFYVNLLFMVFFEFVLIDVIDKKVNDVELVEIVIILILKFNNIVVYVDKVMYVISYFVNGKIVVKE